MFLSQRAIENTNWSTLRESIVLPFFDAEMTFCGTTIILAHQADTASHINLLDSKKKNNLLTY